MPKDGERRASTILPLIPEWAEEGRCASCWHAMASAGKGGLRCDASDVPVTSDFSCAKYVPAPELAEARRMFPDMVP